MANKAILENCRIYAAGYDLSGETNTIELGHKTDIHDVTCFDSGGKEKQSSLEDTELSMEGFHNVGVALLDAALYAEVGLDSTVISVSVDKDEGDEAFTFIGAMTYTPMAGGEVGAPFKWSGAAGGKGKTIQGTIMKIGVVAAASPGNGTAFQLGAVSATQSLWSSLHVTDDTGTTITVIIQSDDDVGMASPVTRITHTAFTATGAERKSQAGAITDDWYRMSWTSSGGNFTIFVVVGIK